MTRPIEVVIDSIGAAGDGLAEFGGKPLYVPFTVPGDRLRVVRPRRGDRGRLVELLAPGGDRVAPACRHFGDCGGCALQHLRPAAYRSWKQQLVRTALARRGLDDVTVEAPILVAPGSRRRVTLRYRGGGGRASLGFNERGSNRIVDLGECPVAAKPIEALMAPLKALLARMLPNGAAAELALCATETGIDMVIRTLGEANMARREDLAAFARAQDLARVSWVSGGGQDGEPETIVERRAPLLHFGAVAVSPPAGGFLQATVEGEEALRGRALAAIESGARRGLDLFAGCGSFALPAAGGCSIHAVDSEPSMLAALQAAGRHAPGLKAVTIERRDLFRRPVRTDELKRYDFVFIDPPRAGARAQAEQIARSRVPTVISASCNPATFARDARALVDGGYRLDKVTPVDQFLWSAQVELIGVFRRI